MYLTLNNCDETEKCIKSCPTKSIRLINGVAFSCITCGICSKNCPNQAIFKNRYGGYVVDRAKCNGCGMCMYNCPTNNIKIEDGIVYGICSRCGVCADEYPKCRIDGFELERDKQITLIKSLQMLNPPLKDVAYKKDDETQKVSRTYFGTDFDKCILCGRCDEYCPNDAIHVKVDWDIGICKECRICSDVCPNGSMNKYQIVNTQTCTLCLNCIKVCPNNAIGIEDFKINVNKLNQKPTGSIVSCLNCGLCADLSKNKSLIRNEDKLRYDPTQDTYDITHEKAIRSCPVNTLKISTELYLYDEFEDHEKVFVAISKNEIFGFVALLKECCCIDNEDNTPWLDFLFVDEVYRNRHIGLALIEAVCSYTKQLGYSDIFLCTVSHKEFYEKNGFFIKYTTFNYNNKHNEKPLFVMQKTI